MLIPETINQLIDKDNLVRFLEIFDVSLDEVCFGFKDIHLIT